MKKLLSMLGAMGLVATSSASVVACGHKDTTKLDLSALTGDKATLIIYVDVNASLASQDILKAFNEKNNLTLELNTDVTITTAMGTAPTYTATIEAAEDSKTTINKIDVTITVVATIDLSTLSDDKAALEASTFDVITELPAAQFILDAFNKKNESSLVLTTDVITVDDIKSKPASIESKEPTLAVFTATIRAIPGLKIVSGSVDVTITVTPKPKIDLSQITGENTKIEIKVQDINVQPNDEIILDAFNKKNNLTLKSPRDVEINPDLFKPDPTKPTYTYTGCILAKPESRIVFDRVYIDITITI